jgi:hypothetical protein
LPPFSIAGMWNAAVFAIDFRELPLRSGLTNLKPSDSSIGQGVRKTMPYP